MNSSPDDHDPAAFSAEVARRMRAAVVSEVPRRRGLKALAVVATLALSALVVVILLHH